MDCKQISARRVEALLRDEFSRDIEAQRDNVPDWRGIASMAGLDRRAQAGKQRGQLDASQARRHKRHKHCQLPRMVEDGLRPQGDSLPGRRERGARVRRRRSAGEFGPAVLALALLVVAACILAVAAAVLATPPGHCPAACACEIRQE